MGTIDLVGVTFDKVRSDPLETTDGFALIEQVLTVRKVCAESDLGSLLGVGFFDDIISKTIRAIKIKGDGCQRGEQSRSRGVVMSRPSNAYTNLD